MQWIALQIFALITFLLIVITLQTKKTVQAFEWAVGVGLIGCLYSWLLLPASSPASDAYLPLRIMAFVVLGSYAALVIVAAFTMPPGGPRWGSLLWSTVGVGFLLFVLFGASAPPLTRRSDWDRMKVLSVVRKIHIAQEAYSRQNPEKGFAESLDELETDSGGKLGADVVLIQARNHYRLSFAAGERDEEGRISHYTIVAQPIDWGRGGCRSYFMNESGVIRETNEDRPATGKDMPVG